VGNAEDKPKWWKLGTGLESENLPRLGITVFDQQRLLDNPIIDFQQDHGGLNLLLFLCQVR